MIMIEELTKQFDETLGLEKTEEIKSDNYIKWSKGVLIYRYEKSTNRLELLMNNSDMITVSAVKSPKIIASVLFNHSLDEMKFDEENCLVHNEGLPKLMNVEGELKLLDRRYEDFMMPVAEEVIDIQTKIEGSKDEK